MSQLFVRTGIRFSSSRQTLEHISVGTLARDIVHDSYPAALLEHEATFSTGITLEQHAVAIPHCETVRIRSSAIYLTRPDAPVPSQHVGDGGEIDISFIIMLIVENLAAQLKLPRRLLSELQNPHTLEALLATSDDRLLMRFQQFILKSEPNAVTS